MNDTALHAVVHEYAKELKLPAVAREYARLASRAAHEGWQYEEYLRDLLDKEIHERRSRAATRRIRQAGFPEVRTLDQVDWDALKGVNRPRVLELATCGFIEAAQDVIFAGPVGTGKTHLAVALGVEAARRRFGVRFVRAADLVRDLMEARDAFSLGRLQQRLTRVPLLILDELGFVPFDRAGGELLFNLLAARHGIRSTIITTNLSFSEWVQVFGDEKLTCALLDRVAENSHVVTLNGPSYRVARRQANPRLHGDLAAALPPRGEGSGTLGAGETQGKTRGQQAAEAQHMRQTQAAGDALEG